MVRREFVKFVLCKPINQSSFADTIFPHDNNFLLCLWSHLQALFQTNKSGLLNSTQLLTNTRYFIIQITINSIHANGSFEVRQVKSCSVAVVSSVAVWSSHLSTNRMGFYSFQSKCVVIVSSSCDFPTRGGL